MEKQFREDQLTRRLMKDAGLERPSLNFSANVMKAIQAKQEVNVYKPLISSTGWIIFAGIFVLSVIGLYITTSGFPAIPDFGLSLNMSWNFPTIQLSQTMIFAISGLLLFLLQIPFLKGLMEREYR